MPGNRAVTLTGGRSIRAILQSPYAEVVTAPWTQVSSAAGTYRFEFSAEEVSLAACSPQNQGGQITAYHDPHSTTVMVNFTQLDIISAAGTETYRFNPAAAMALASATDVSGNVTSFTYGTDGYDDPLTETDALGNAKTYTYDPATRIMTSMTDALGTVTAYGIMSQQIGDLYIQGLKISEVVSAPDGETRTTLYSYDHPTFHGLVTKSWTLSSNPDAMPSSVTTTTLGATTDAQGNKPGWWAEVTQSSGPATEQGTLGSTLTSTTTVHDLSGNKRSVIDARGFITNFDYDGHLRLIQVTHPDGSHKNLAYDAHGNLLSETNESGVTTLHEYDNLNRRLKTKLHLADGTDIATTNTYNARNQIVTQTDPRGKVTTNTYDEAGRVTSTNDGGLISHYADYVGGGVFDSSGFKPKTTISPTGVTTHLEYDAMYRELSRTVVYGQGLTVNPLYLAYQTAAASRAAQQAAADVAAAQTAPTAALTAAVAAAAAAQTAATAAQTALTAATAAAAQQIANQLQSATTALAAATQYLNNVTEAANAHIQAAQANTNNKLNYIYWLAALPPPTPPQVPALITAESNARSGYQGASLASGFADQALEDAQSNLESLQLAVETAQSAAGLAQAAVAAAQMALADLLAQDQFADQTSAQASIMAAQMAADAAQADVGTAQAAADAAQVPVDVAQTNANNAAQNATNAYATWQTALAALQSANDDLNNAAQDAHEAADDAQSALDTASADLTSAQSDYSDAVDALQPLVAGTQEYIDAQAAVTDAATAVTEKEGAVSSAQSQYDAAKAAADLADAACNAFGNTAVAWAIYEAAVQGSNQVSARASGDYRQAQADEAAVVQQENANVALALAAKVQAVAQHQAALTAAAAQPSAELVALGAQAVQTAAQAVRTAQVVQAVPTVQAAANAAVQAAAQAATSAATHAVAAAEAETIADADLEAAAAAAQAQIAHQNLSAVKTALAQATGVPWTDEGGSSQSAGPPPPAMVPPAVITETTYDAVGKPLTSTDTLGRITRNTYNGLGELVNVIHPDGTTQQTTYTHHGKPWQVTNENGHTTTTTYDAAGRPVMVMAPEVNGEVAVHTTDYDAAGNAIRVTDPLGRETDTEYDERNRAIAVYAPPVWDAAAQEFVRPVTQTTYDVLDQVLTVTDPLGNVTTKYYDEAGRNWQVVAPIPEPNMAAPTTTTTFDAGGLALTVTNALNQTVTNTYDIHGRLITTVDAEGIINTFAYDDAGNRTSVKDGLNQETTFTYDGLNRLVSQTFANGDTWSYSYNAVHKLSQTSPRGITTHYTYDARSRLRTTHAPAHGTTPALARTYSYDPAGHLLSVTEAGNTAANVAYAYDALGRVTSETSLGITHSYGYDLAGNRTQASYGTGRTVQTSYDALNRPELISEGGRVTQYGYDRAGRAVLLVAGNGQTSQNSYDALGHLVDRTLFKTTGMSNNEVLAEFEWMHDALGNVTAQHETWPGDASRSAGIRSTTMTYDGNNRLISETVSDPATGVTTTTYGYDAANNRLQKTVEGGSDPGVWSYLYNAANQLTSWVQRASAGGTPLKSATLHYDAAGNRISQTVTGSAGSGINPPTAASGTTSYQWDAQDRLSSVTLPNGETHAYDYDYRTRRTGAHKLVSGVQQAMTAIVFAGGLSLAEFETSTNTLPTTPTVEYTRGQDMGGGVGGMLYSIRSSSIQNQASSIKYSLSNGRGDIVAQADSNATLTWTASYEAYGRRTQETGSNPDKQRGNSKDEDPTGLLNEGFRYRDLETGVWLSRDPAGFVDGPNLYAYCTQNPWSHFDAEGLWLGCLVDLAFMAWDTGQAMTGGITRETYQKRMLLNTACLGANLISGGIGGNGMRLATTAGRVVEVASTVSRVEKAGELTVRAAAVATQVISHSSDSSGASGNEASGHGGGGTSPESSSKETNIENNAKAGLEREQKTHEQLVKENPGKEVVSQRLLRDENGKVVKDQLTGEARRLDHAVLNAEARTAKTVETTGQNVDKTAQLAKESRIIEQGGQYIRHPKTKELHKVEGVSELRRHD